MDTTINKIPARAGSCALAAILLLPLFARGNAPPTESTSSAFQRLASQFEFFGVKEYLRGRSKIYLADPSAMKRYIPLLKEFDSRNDPTADLLALLHSPNPKIRVLAIMALPNKGEANALPEIQKLTTDQEIAFPDPPVDQNLIRISGIGPPQEPTTVGEAADAVIELYLSPHDYYPRHHAHPTGTAFAQYWEHHKDRPYCVGWFLVRLLRAGEDQNPIPEACLERIHHLRAEIDQLPLEDRRWVLIDLAAYERGNLREHTLVADDELPGLCHGLGTQTLRQMIRSVVAPANAPRDPALPSDPDINPGSLSWFVYDHAKDLLTEKNADDVLAAGNVILAAELRPAMASKWLRVAVEKAPWWFSAIERGQDLAALWRLVGPTESDFILNRYFNDVPQSGEFPCERMEFLEESAKQPRPEFRELVAKIILDPRFDQAGPDSTCTLALIVNKWVAHPIASEGDLRSAYRFDELERGMAE